MSNPLQIEIGTPNPNPNPHIEKKRHLHPDSSMESAIRTCSYLEEFTPFDVLFAEFMEESKAKRMKMTAEEEQEGKSSSSSSSSSPTSTLEHEASSILSSFHEGHRLVLLKPPHLLPSAEARLSWAVEDLKQMTPPLPLTRKLKLSPTPSPSPSPPSAQTLTPPHVSSMMPTANAAAESTETLPPPPPLRISKLKMIIRILKKMHSSLRKDSSSSSPPTCEEQIIYSLIACNVNTNIFLFYREDFLLCCSDINLPLLCVNPHITEATTEDDGANEEEEEEDEEVVEDPLDGEYVIEKLEANAYDYCNKLCDFLTECRPSIIPPEEDPLRIRHHHQGLVIDNTKSLQRKQQLLNILRDLEEMGRSRHYAPPHKGEEIECYKNIRDWTTFSLLFIEANHTFQSYVRTPVTCMWDLVPDAGHLHFHDCIPDDHVFALAFDRIPMFRSLVKKCKYRVSRIFSNQSKQSTLEDEEEDEEEEEVNFDVHDNNDGDIRTGGVGIRTDQIQVNGSPVMKSRLLCLHMIITKFIRMGALPCNSFPTNEEVRLYAQIAEHVNSSLRLLMKTDTEKITGTACYEANAANITSSAVPATKGSYKNIRERSLLGIVSDLNAMKSSCLVVVPTEEDMKYYMMLLQGLDYNFMSCPVAADHGVEGADSEEAIASLKSQLASIYRSELNFLDEAKEESASIINMVRRVIMAHEGESASSEDAFNWLEENKVQLVDKMKMFFGGRREQLDQLIVILEEMGCLLSNIVSRLTDATRAADVNFFKKKYAIVARDMRIALYLMDKVNHPVSGTI